LAAFGWQGGHPSSAAWMPLQRPAKNSPLNRTPISPCICEYQLAGTDARLSDRSPWSGRTPDATNTNGLRNGNTPPVARNRPQWSVVGRGGEHGETRAESTWLPTRSGWPGRSLGRLLAVQWAGFVAHLMLEGLGRSLARMPRSWANTRAEAWRSQLLLVFHFPAAELLTILPTRLRMESPYSLYKV